MFRDGGLARRLHRIARPSPMGRMMLLAVALTAGLPGPTAAAAESRLDRIKRDGRLRACIWPGYYGISYRNPRDGTLTGLDVDMAKDFASELGVRVDFINSTLGTVGGDLTADRCDVAMFAIRVNNDRLNSVRFVAPHLRSGLYAVTTTDNNLVKSWSDLDKPGRAIAVQYGTSFEHFMREQLKNAELVVVRPPERREDELLAGRVDAFITDYAYAQNIKAQHDWARIIAPPTPLAVSDAAYAVAKDDPAWFDRVNQFVLEMKRNGRLMKAAAANGLAAMVVAD